jgi:molybdopterin-guanine dinucleotide biosynthesis protein
MRPTVVSVSGFSSDAGKTTVICRLLKLLPGWEAIKITRGHYRSCGKDPEACCVSSMLGEHPHVITDERSTRITGKDTGRFWEAGAANVHWVIGADHQIEEGITEALSRVRADGVFVEGSSFLRYISADYSLMVSGPEVRDIKSSSVRVMPQMNALLITRAEESNQIEQELREKLRSRGSNAFDLPIAFEKDLPQLAAEIVRLHRARTG